MNCPLVKHCTLISTSVGIFLTALASITVGLVMSQGYERKIEALECELATVKEELARSRHAADKNREMALDTLKALVETGDSLRQLPDSRELRMQLQQDTTERLNKLAENAGGADTPQK